jgi:hypothetical protein
VFTEPKFRRLLATEQQDEIRSGKRTPLGMKRPSGEHLPIETISLDGESTSFILLGLTGGSTSILGLLELTGRTIATVIPGLLELTGSSTLIFGTAARLGDCPGGQRYG